MVNIENKQDIFVDKNARRTIIIELDQDNLLNFNAPIAKRTFLENQVKLKNVKAKPFIVLVCVRTDI
jgi:hypothetical protein